MLRRAPVDITLIDRNNHHLFQPLLYQVAAAYLDPEQIAKPVRGIFRRQKNLSFKMTEMSGVDFEHQVVATPNGGVPYDYLILAVGGQTSFFGMKGVQKHGFSLKGLADGIGIRNHLLTCFEHAALEPDRSKQQALLTTDFDGEEVKLKDQSAIPARTLIWTAGIQAAEITETLNLPLSANKRVIVEPTLQVPRHPELWRRSGETPRWRK